MTWSTPPPHPHHPHHPHRTPSLSPYRANVVVPQIQVHQGWVLLQALRQSLAEDKFVKKNMVKFRKPDHLRLHSSGTQSEVAGYRHQRNITKKNMGSSCINSTLLFYLVLHQGASVHDTQMELGHQNAGRPSLSLWIANVVGIPTQVR